MRKSWSIRGDAKAVSPVIATILMVAITVVLAAVLYVMVTGLLAGPGASKPVVTFNSPTAVTNGFTFAVAGASQSKAISNYKVNLQVNSTVGTAVPLAASMSFPSLLGSTYTIAFADIGGTGNLVGGDTFTVTRPTAIAQTTYKVILLWSDGSQIQSATYP